MPEVLEQMKAGYIQVQIDQQPYEQGFMPVMEVYLAKTAGLAPADIDTGQGVVTPDQVDAVEAALRQADDLFNARTALLLPDERGVLAVHPAGTFRIGEHERAVAAVAWERGQSAGRGTEVLPGDGLHLPLLRAGQALGVFAVRLPPEITELSTAQRDLIEEADRLANTPYAVRG